MDFNLGSQEVRRGWGPGFVAVALAVPGSGVQVSGGAALEALGLWSKNKDHASLMVAFLLYGYLGIFMAFCFFPSGHSQCVPLCLVPAVMSLQCIIDPYILTNTKAFLLNVYTSKGRILGGPKLIANRPASLIFQVVHFTPLKFHSIVYGF